MKLSKKKLLKLAEQINTEIFNSALNIYEINFKNKRKDKHNARAWFYTNDWDEPIIEIINNEHRTEKEIFHTIAHELIHYYQWKVGLFVWNHNTAFFRYYKGKICKKYNIESNRYF